jgi:hypothetical protein
MNSIRPNFFSPLPPKTIKKTPVTLKSNKPSLNKNITPKKLNFSNNNQKGGNLKRRNKKTYKAKRR